MSDHPQIGETLVDWMDRRVSSCHGAQITLSGTEDFVGRGEAVTVYPVCTDCGDACDTKERVRRPPIGPGGER